MNHFELVILAAVLRVVGSFHDGLSMRTVSWTSWHLVNWLRRDAIIIWITIKILGWPWVSGDVFADWILVTAINVLLHRSFYWLGEMTH